MTTKTRKERIAEIEFTANLEGTLPEESWKLVWNEVRMAQKALEIIREQEAELKVAITALRKIQNVSYPSSSVTWEDCCTAHEKCAQEALCKLNN